MFGRPGRKVEKQAEERGVQAAKWQDAFASVELPFTSGRKHEAPIQDMAIPRQ